MKYFKRRRIVARRRIDRRKQQREGRRSVTSALEQAGRKSKKTVDVATKTVLDSTNVASKGIASAATSTVDRSRLASSKILDNASTSVAWLSEVSQALLATELSRDLNHMLQSMTDGSSTIYSSAMDEVYNSTGIGGSYHRIFDGGHDIFGAVRAVRGAVPDDSILQEAMATLQELFKDVITVRGLPIATWDYETYYQVVGYLDDNFHIPRDWFYDLNTYDAAELVGGSIGILAVAFSWNRTETKTFSRLVGSMGLSAALSANPLLLVITIVALAKAFHKAHQSGEYTEFVAGSLEGGVGAGATITAVSLVGVAGGPAGVALLAGLTTGVLVNMATKKVSFVEIGQFMAEEATVAAYEARELVRQRKISQFMAGQLNSAMTEAREVTQRVKEKYANTSGNSV